MVSIMEPVTTGRSNHHTMCWSAAVNALLLVATLTGCQTVHPVMATPNLYLDTGVNPFEDVPPPLQNNKVEVIYGTDRLQDAGSTVDEEAARRLTYYGHGRSHSLAFGRATVVIGQDVPWDVVVEQSLLKRRDIDAEPVVVDTDEMGQFPPSHTRHTVVEQELVPNEDVMAEEHAAIAAFHNLLRESLSKTDRKEAVVFVHGYHNTFPYAVTTIAQLWHFMGRTGLPILYSWPAGRGGLRGYFADRESGEFTVFHLKQFLRALADCPELERINILAHSRGTDVVLTALRELYIELAAAGESTQSVLKLGNVILAAPDLDAEVARQRIGAEGLVTIAERMTIYLSAKDKAIGLSTWLFGSAARIGRLSPSEVSAETFERLSHIPQLQVIYADVKEGDFFGHGYFYLNPAVSSDVILTLRDNLDPGEENGRPLEQLSIDFWRIDDSYMRRQKP